MKSRALVATREVYLDLMNASRASVSLPYYRSIAELIIEAVLGLCTLQCHCLAAIQCTFMRIRDQIAGLQLALSGMLCS